MSSDRPTLDQRRAQHAWQAVERAKTLRDDAPKDFAREAKQLPVRIKTAGLGQALAFLNAKAKSDTTKGGGWLLKELGEWLLTQRCLATRPQDANDCDAVIQAIISGNADLLRRATEEALLYLQWLTRFCEAELGTGEG